MIKAPLNKKNITFRDVAAYKKLHPLAEEPDFQRRTKERKLTSSQQTWLVKEKAKWSGKEDELEKFMKDRYPSYAWNGKPAALEYLARLQPQ